MATGILLALAVLAFAHSANPANIKIPAYLKTCSRNDPKLNECALKNGREIIPHLAPGDRSIRLPPLDPLVLERLEVNPSGNSRSAGLQLTCNNCHIIGLGGSQLEDIRVDLPNDHLELELSIPFLTILGKYSVTGRILVLPITGNGDANITLTSLNIKLGLDWKIIKKKGEEHAQITKYKVNFTAQMLQIMLADLFGGDKLLGDNMNNFLNENWEEVLKDFRPAVSDTIGETIKLILNNIFDLIPFDMVFTNK